VAQAPWTAEHVVDAEAARRMIAAQGWGLAQGSVAPFGRGFDNTAYLVDETWVFRFPRRTIAGPLLLTEAAVLPAIAPRLPLAVPLPCLVGQPTEGYPWAFTGYRLLRGRTASSAALTEAQRIAVARPVAEFLAALHAVPAEDVRALGVADVPWRKLDVAAQVGRIREEFAGLRELGVVDAGQLERVEEVIAAALAIAPRPAATLVHGDLYSQHVLVDEQATPTAVIDWGDVHVGDRAVDVAFAWIFLPPAGREAFVRAYGGVDEETWRLARLRALQNAALDIRYGLAEDEPEIVREGRLTLAWAL
jgi:aminoglycoside phosphotransferase (APT) family kinase protein